MSLWEIDKGNDSRLTPSVNANDVLQGALKAKSTDSISYRTEGATEAGSVTIKDAQIIVNDGTNDRILIGYQESGF